MDKELLKRFMQSMSETGTDQGRVPVSHNGKGYDVSIKTDQPEGKLRSKFLKGDAPSKPVNFRATIMPMYEEAKLVRSASGTPEEVIAHLEEEIQHIEQYYANRDANRVKPKADDRLK